MKDTIKCPPVVQGSRFVHRRNMTRIDAVCEQGYFNMLQHVKAKPEVRS